MVNWQLAIDHFKVELVLYATLKTRRKAKNFWNRNWDARIANSELKGVFERRASTGSELFTFLSRGFAKIFS